MPPEKDCREIVKEIVERHRHRKAPVLPILHDIYDTFSYLPREALEETAKLLGIPTARIYSAATFYHLFSTEQQGKYVIRVCDTLTCHMKKSREILRAIEEHLGIRVGETTPDGLFTLKTTSCIGQCDKAPAMMINDKIYVSLTPEKVIKIIESYKGVKVNGGRE
ncbi:MAG: NADH-quinone oxidoreductase subunit NuoE [Thermoplasmata archaeon]|nr:NADH-quinone oxidoreductase subunit NuoE [Thermoplasmata archaeon]